MMPTRLDLVGAGFAQIGKGYFAILIDQGQGNVPYQGITPIAGGSLSACAETYFAQSEQLPTRFALSFGQSRKDWRRGELARRRRDAAAHAQGLAIRQGRRDWRGRAAGRGRHAGRAKSENWTRANILLDTVEELELIGPHRAADRPAGAAVSRRRPARLRCAAGALRLHLFGRPGARQRLSIYSAEDIGDMTTDDGHRHRRLPVLRRALRIRSRRRWGSRPTRGRMTADPFDLLVAALGRAGDGVVGFRPEPGGRSAGGAQVAAGGRAGRRCWTARAAMRLILTKRSSALKHHPGQIAFPGRQASMPATPTSPPPPCARPRKRSALPGQCRGAGHAADRMKP